MTLPVEVSCQTRAYRKCFVTDTVGWTGAHSDCSAYHPVPLDLDRLDGGSVPFGGPLHEGYIHMSEDNFIASGLERDSTASDTMVHSVFPAGS